MLSDDKIKKIAEILDEKESVIKELYITTNIDFNDEILLNTYLLKKSSEVLTILSNYDQFKPYIEKIYNTVSDIKDQINEINSPKSLSIKEKLTEGVLLKLSNTKLYNILVESVDDKEIKKKVIEYISPISHHTDTIISESFITSEPRTMKFKNIFEDAIKPIKPIEPIKPGDVTSDKTSSNDDSDDDTKPTTDTDETDNMEKFLNADI